MAAAGALRQWGESHAFAPGETHPVLIDDESGAPVPPLRVARPDGTALTARNTGVRWIQQPRCAPRLPQAAKRGAGGA